MIEVHIEDRWDLMRKDIYIIDRHPGVLYLFNYLGYLDEVPQGTRITDLGPTFIIKDEWLEQFIDKLDPLIERASDETSITLWTERHRVDKMINYLIGYEDA